MRYCLLLLALLLAQFGPSLADDIFVKNKQFRGEVVGEGMGSSLSLTDLAKALNLELTPGSDFYLLGDYQIPFWVGENGTTYARLWALKNAGITVVQNTQLGSIDISLKDREPAPQGRVVSVPAGIFSNFPHRGNTRRATQTTKLLYFWKPDSQECQDSEDGLGRFTARHHLEVVRINVTDTSSPDYTRFQEFAPGERVPSWVVLDKDNKKQREFYGTQTLESLMQQTREFWKN